MNSVFFFFFFNSVFFFFLFFYFNINKCPFILANPKLQDHEIQVLCFDIRLIESHERIFDNVMSMFGRVSQVLTALSITLQLAAN
jgi:hypothetical protein